jgi:hypothetical protein
MEKRYEQRRENGGMGEREKGGISLNAPSHPFTPSVINNYYICHV